MTEAKEKAAKPATVEFDLNSLDTVSGSDAGAKIAIVHPATKEPVGINIFVLGKHSHAFRDLMRERINKRVKAESLAARRGKPLEPKTAEEAERDALEMLVACTTGWETEFFHVDEKGQRIIDDTKPTIRLGEERLEFNAQNALRVYNNNLVIREQVDDAIGDLENFIPA